MIPRIIIKSIQNDLFKGKAIIITGPRQVGKTTLLEALRNDHKLNTLWLNCDEPDIRLSLENVTTTQLKAMIGKHLLVFIDEAQRVKNIGLTLKLLVDHFKEVQIVATGSSALELANEINEPLTGRKREYHLYPFSTAEMINSSTELEEKRLLEQRLIYGFYPDIVNDPGNAQRSLMALSNDYLYKDLLSLESIRKPALLEKILLALAFQIGSEVSFTEIAQSVGADIKTVEHYISLLEKCFIVFQVGAFSRNLRNEIKKGKKIYFYDNGIRNAIIKNFNGIQMRQDIGALWENFLMSERRKFNDYNNHFVNSYFWRTHAQQEIDLLEESGGILSVKEFKWNKLSKAKQPFTFSNAYPDSNFGIIHPGNYLDFLTIK
ncbi:MAG: ATP-binding protein [Bacteroidota bacterium]